MFSAELMFLLSLSLSLLLFLLRVMWRFSHRCLFLKLQSIWSRRTRRRFGTGGNDALSRYPVMFIPRAISTTDAANNKHHTTPDRQTAKNLNNTKLLHRSSVCQFVIISFLFHKQFSGFTIINTYINLIKSLIKLFNWHI